MASAPQPKNLAHRPGQAEVDHHEEDRRKGHHDEHHDGGHRGFLLGRPGHLLDLANHLTHVLGRVDRCHRVELFPTTPTPLRGEVVAFCSSPPQELLPRYYRSPFRLPVTSGVARYP